MADLKIVKSLDEKALTIRKLLLDLSVKGIHIGGDYSMCEVMTVIWQYAMKYDPAQPHWEERDRFVLSKGHGSAVTSLNQALRGCFPVEDIFKEYATDYGRFGMHSCNLINPYVDVSTGSLGHGFPVAAGMAAALKAKKSQSRVYVVMGDGEITEGSVWETAMSAPDMKLGNLVAVVDRNRLSLFSDISDYLDPVADKWRAFKWNVIELDGHNTEALVDAFDHLPPADSDIPTMIIANTIKGKGVAAMENNPSWHMGGAMPEFAIEAKEELDDAFIQKWGTAE